MREVPVPIQFEENRLALHIVFFGQSASSFGHAACLGRFKTVPP